ncbi:MAG: PTS sugar transporter subunit IIA [Planctomycetota bacterium]|nr:MAG: PTS sugar transporter subunit IIA [Planctomycetota bacterium]
MNNLLNLLSPERVGFLSVADKKSALNEMVNLLCGSDAVHDCEALRRAIFEREKILSTGIGLGVAVPHAKISSVTDFVVAMGITRAPVDFGSLDDKPVRLLVAIAGPADRQSDYLKILARVTLALKKQDLRDALLAAESPDEALKVLAGK